MKIKYYGTSAAEGVPAMFCRCPVCDQARRLGGKDVRTRPQAAIDDALLIDFGPDTFLHTLTGGLCLEDMRACIVTHPHADHLCLGEVGYRARGFAAQTLPGPFHFYGSDSVVERLEGLADWAKDPERLAWVCVRPFEAFEVEGCRVTALPAAHGIGEASPIRCFIYALEKGGRRMLYAHDTGIFPEETWAWLAGKRFDLVSMDCTIQKHSGDRNHMGVGDVLRVKRRMEEAGCGDADTAWIVNHFSHNGGLLHAELEALVKPHGLIVAYDGMEIEV